MRRTLRITGTLTALTGAALTAWAVLVWQWQDPFTGAYNRWEQRQLAQSFERRSSELHLPAATASSPSGSQVALAARCWRKASAVGATHRWLTYATPVSVQLRTAPGQDGAAVLAG